MEKMIFNRAYSYKYSMVNYKGEPKTYLKYIAVAPGVKIEELIKQWNVRGTSSQSYELVEEIPLQTAIHKRGLFGSTIASDWKLLPHMPYVSIEVQEL